ncbi:hypothetical protein COLO4_07629 [Corchorus olitorius]|uniref:Uncharacterized protein n=1 Tax=Corchorus olitorius TaxID=93759 RepID=A0A1R3KJC0_9ROSI|nr:hypothetical protein COLO4_07629 [Corchorus olitorius]
MESMAPHFSMKDLINQKPKLALRSCGSYTLLDHPLQSCSVKLVSSPDENCNNGIDGSPLRYEGPVAFRPAPSP